MILIKKKKKEFVCKQCSIVPEKPITINKFPQIMKYIYILINLDKYISNLFQICNTIDQYLVIFLFSF